MGLKKANNYLNITHNIENNGKTKNNQKNNKGKQDKKNKNLKFTNLYEINTLKYKDVLTYDKRNCFEYYISLLRTKHPILFTFCPIKDYNSRIIKLCLFFLVFSINYAINFAFFNEDIIHKIFEEQGKYDVRFFLPKIGISFAITRISSILLNFIFLSERFILKIKQQPGLESANSKASSLERTLIIKYIIFYITSFLFLIFFWMLLSSFGAVYQNTQIFVFKNALISFSFSLVYPFIINIIPSIIRMISLNDNSGCNEIFYNINKFLQIL